LPNLHDNLSCGAAFVDCSQGRGDVVNHRIQITGHQQVGEQ